MLFVRSGWFTRRWLGSTIHLRANRRERFLNFRPFVAHKTMFGSANYSACVVYTKTIIHLSVGESDGYLPPLRWIIVNYNCFSFTGQTEMYCMHETEHQNYYQILTVAWGFTVFSEPNSFLFPTFHTFFQVTRSLVIPNSVDFEKCQSLYSYFRHAHLGLFKSAAQKELVWFCLKYSICEEEIASS